MSLRSAFFLVGPTAVGKTEVGQWLAETDGFDILSADSMLAYRGMDVGTAKPSPAMRERVRYWGIDRVEPGETFSVGAFRALAESALDAVRDKGGRMIVVGGTGLYVKSLTDGLAPAPAGGSAARAYWQQVYVDGGLKRLAEELVRKSKDLYDSVRDKRNPRRLIRALELAEAGVLSRERRWDAKTSPPVVGLQLDPVRLKQRIEERVRRMFESGLIEEAERLLRAGTGPDTTAFQAIGYWEALSVLNGRSSREDAIARTATRTRHLAKRQLTWFRHQANVNWVEIRGDETVAEIGGRVLDLWRRLGPTPIADA